MREHLTSQQSYIVPLPAMSNPFLAKPPAAASSNLLQQIIASSTPLSQLIASNKNIPTPGLNQDAKQGLKIARTQSVDLMGASPRGKEPGKEDGVGRSPRASPIRKNFDEKPSLRVQNRDKQNNIDPKLSTGTVALSITHQSQVIGRFQVSQSTFLNPSARPPRFALQLPPPLVRQLAEQHARTLQGNYTLNIGLQHSCQNILVKIQQSPLNPLPDNILRRLKQGLGFYEPNDERDKCMEKLLAQNQHTRNNMPLLEQIGKTALTMKTTKFLTYYLLLCNKNQGRTIQGHTRFLLEDKTHLLGIYRVLCRQGRLSTRKLVTYQQQISILHNLSLHFQSPVHHPLLLAYIQLLSTILIDNSSEVAEAQLHTHFLPYIKNLTNIVEESSPLRSTLDTLVLRMSLIWPQVLQNSQLGRVQAFIRYYYGGDVLDVAHITEITKDMEAIRDYDQKMAAIVHQKIEKFISKHANCRSHPDKNTQMVTALECLLLLKQAHKAQLHSQRAPLLKILYNLVPVALLPLLSHPHELPELTLSLLATHYRTSARQNQLSLADLQTHTNIADSGCQAYVVMEHLCGLVDGGQVRQGSYGGLEAVEAELDRLMMSAGGSCLRVVYLFAHQLRNYAEEARSRGRSSDGVQLERVVTMVTTCMERLLVLECSSLLPLPGLLINLQTLACSIAKYQLLPHPTQYTHTNTETAKPTALLQPVSIFRRICNLYESLIARIDSLQHSTLLQSMTQVLACWLDKTPRTQGQLIFLTACQFLCKASPSAHSQYLAKLNTMFRNINLLSITQQVLQLINNLNTNIDKHNQVVYQTCITVAQLLSRGIISEDVCRALLTEASVVVGWCMMRLAEEGQARVWYGRLLCGVVGLYSRHGQGAKAKSRYRTQDRPHFLAAIATGTHSLPQQHQQTFTTIFNQLFTACTPTHAQLPLLLLQLSLLYQSALIPLLHPHMQQINTFILSILQQHSQYPQYLCRCLTVYQHMYELVPGVRLCRRVVELLAAAVRAAMVGAGAGGRVLGWMGLLVGEMVGVGGSQGWGDVLEMGFMLVARHLHGEKEEPGTQGDAMDEGQCTRLIQCLCVYTHCPQSLPQLLAAPDKQVPLLASLLTCSQACLANLPPEPPLLSACLVAIIKLYHYMDIIGNFNSEITSLSLYKQRIGALVKGHRQGRMVESMPQGTRKQIWGLMDRLGQGGSLGVGLGAHRQDWLTCMLGLIGAVIGGRQEKTSSYRHFYMLAQMLQQCQASGYPHLQHPQLSTPVSSLVSRLLAPSAPPQTAWQLIVLCSLTRALPAKVPPVKLLQFCNYALTTTTDTEYRWIVVMKACALGTAVRRLHAGVDPGRVREGVAGWLRGLVREWEGVRGEGGKVAALEMGVLGGGAEFRRELAMLKLAGKPSTSISQDPSKTVAKYQSNNPELTISDYFKLASLLSITCSALTFMTEDSPNLTISQPLRVAITKCCQQIQREFVTAYDEHFTETPSDPNTLHKCRNNLNIVKQAVKRYKHDLTISRQQLYLNKYISQLMGHSLQGFQFHMFRKYVPNGQQNQLSAVCWFNSIDECLAALGAEPNYRFANQKVLQAVLGIGNKSMRLSSVRKNR